MVGDGDDVRMGLARQPCDQVVLVQHVFATHAGGLPIGQHGRDRQQSVVSEFGIGRLQPVPFGVHAPTTLGIGRRGAQRHGLLSFHRRQHVQSDVSVGIRGGEDECEASPPTRRRDALGERFDSRRRRGRDAEHERRAIEVRKWRFRCARLVEGRARVAAEHRRTPQLTAKYAVRRVDEDLRLQASPIRKRHATDPSVLCVSLYERDVRQRRAAPRLP